MTEYKMKKVLVYTAIFGKKGLPPFLINPNLALEDTDFVCFTDNPLLKSDHYTIVVIEPRFSDPTRDARKIKICGHPKMEGYNTAIWHDYGVVMDCAKLPDLIPFSSKFLISVFKHDETCSYAEARKCIELKKDKIWSLIRQMFFYAFIEKLPTRQGVYETGIMVLDVNTYFGSELQFNWWENVKRFSKRDQLSLPCVKRRFKIEFGLLEGRGNNNPYSTYRGNISDSDSVSNLRISIFQKFGIWLIYKFELYINTHK